MNEDKKQELKKKLSAVPNPPVPNRAHTEMKAKSGLEYNCDNDKTRKSKS